MAVNYEYAQNQINNFNIWKIFADELTHGSKKKVRAFLLYFLRSYKQISTILFDRI